MLNQLAGVFDGMTGPEATQFVFVCLTLPITLTFIWRYARDPWWRTLFGWSLMMIAVAILFYISSVILFRVYGPGYFGRPVMLPLSGAMTFVAMLLRTLVLVRLQRDDNSPL